MHPFPELWVETPQPHGYWSARNSSPLVVWLSSPTSLRVLNWPLNPLLWLQEALRRRPGRGRRGSAQGWSCSAGGEEWRERRGTPSGSGWGKRRRFLSLSGGQFLNPAKRCPQLTPVACLVNRREKAFEGLWQSQAPAALQWQVASSNTKAGGAAENQGGASPTPTGESWDLGLLLYYMDDFVLLPLWYDVPLSRAYLQSLLGSDWGLSSLFHSLFFLLITVAL